MNAIAYETYRQASQIILDAKATIKALRQEGEQAATKARYETVGTVQDKLDAIQDAWEPFNEQIEALETEIKVQYEIADRNFDAWQGLNK